MGGLLHAYWIGRLQRRAKEEIDVGRGRGRGRGRGTGRGKRLGEVERRRGSLATWRRRLRLIADQSIALEPGD